jgi:hypothetical protein
MIGTDDINKRGGTGFLSRPWPLIVAVVLAILAGIQLICVNAPERSEPVVEGFRATTGAVLDGNYVVPAGQFLAVRMDFNHRVDLIGGLRTPSRQVLVRCLVLDAANFERWKVDSDYKRLAETGKVHIGKIELSIDAGTYYLVLDGRHSSVDLPVEANFNVD